MALNTFVKISTVNNLSDARYCAGMEVNQIGFNIEPENEDFTDVQKFNEISGWLSGVEFVGEIGDSSTDKIADTIKGYNLGAIQVANPKQVSEAKAAGLPLILKVDMAMITEDLFKSLKDDVSYFLIESFFEGEISPDLLELAATYPIVMAFGYDASTINNLISNQNLKGIAIKGGKEERPGFKNFDEMADILEAIEIDDTL
jgi:phosphoribosylanthranilate isomerase